MKMLSFPLGISVFFLSCKFNSDITNTDSITGSWQLYNIESFKSKILGDSFPEDVNLQEAVNEGYVLSFFSDGTYSALKGNGQIKSGAWEMEAELLLIDSLKSTDSIKVKPHRESNGKQILTLNIGNNNTVLEFIKVAEPLKDIVDDPFYPANNRWRIQAKESEDSISLTNRLINYLKHLALVLKSAIERKQDIISFKFSEGPVKIYSSGIGIHSYSIVPESWKKTFYNESEASTAYNIYRAYLKKSRYNRPASGNWINDDYNILLSIYSDISKTISK